VVNHILSNNHRALSPIVDDAAELIGHMPNAELMLSCTTDRLRRVFLPTKILFDFRNVLRSMTSSTTNPNPFQFQSCVPIQFLISGTSMVLMLFIDISILNDPVLTIDNLLMIRYPLCNYGMYL
jgi:hypothetical protein